MRDAAGELDNLQPALNVALGVGDHLAVFGRQEMRDLVHVLLDQRLERKHDAGAALRIRGGPSRERFRGGLHGCIDGFGGRERDLRLHRARVGIKNLAFACAVIEGFRLDEMGDRAHENGAPKR